MLDVTIFRYRKKIFFKKKWYENPGYLRIKGQFGRHAMGDSAVIGSVTQLTCDELYSGRWRL